MKWFLVHKKLLILLFVGLVLRIVLNNLIYSPDAASFVIWAKYLHTHRLSDLYEFLPSGYLPYPPLYYYVLKLLGWILASFQILQNEWLSLLVVKIPVLIADSVIAIFIYEWALEWTHKQKLALVASGFYFLHPAVIYTVSVWGQIDSIITCLTLVSLWLITHKKTFLGFVFFTLSCLVKLQSLALLPLIGFWILTQVPKRKMIGYILGCVIVTLFLFLPLIVSKGVDWTVNYFYSLPNQYPYTSVYSYNLWSIFGFLYPDSARIIGIPIKYIGIGLFWFISFGILWPLKTHKKSTYNILFAAFLLWFNFAFFSTRMHSRYLIYSLGFFAPFTAYFPDLAIGLSLLMLVNLLLPSKYPPIQMITDFLNQKNTIILMVGFAFVLFILSMKRYYQLQKNETPT